MQTVTTPLDPARLDLALAHAGYQNRAAVAAALNVSERTLARALSARSRMLLYALERLLGPRWRYVVGESDALST